MACSNTGICPVLDGTIASCHNNCDCRFCGDATLITKCKGNCVASGNAIDTLNKNTAAINQQAVNSVQQSVTGTVQSLLAPFLSSLPLLMERIGLFLFSLVLVVAGFLAVKQ